MVTGELVVAVVVVVVVAVAVARGMARGAGETDLQQPLADDDAVMLAVAATLFSPPAHQSASLLGSIAS